MYFFHYQFVKDQCSFSTPSRDCTAAPNPTPPPPPPNLPPEFQHGEQEEEEEGETTPKHRPSPPPNSTLQPTPSPHPLLPSFLPSFVTLFLTTSQLQRKETAALSLSPFSNPLFLFWAGCISGVWLDWTGWGFESASLLSRQKGKKGREKGNEEGGGFNDPPSPSLPSAPLPFSLLPPWKGGGKGKRERDFDGLTQRPKRPRFPLRPFYSGVGGVGGVSVGRSVGRGSTPFFSLSDLFKVETGENVVLKIPFCKRCPSNPVRLPKKIGFHLLCGAASTIPNKRAKL